MLSGWQRLFFRKKKSALSTNIVADDSALAQMEKCCTDEDAVNYDPTASGDDGSCEFSGCTVDYYRNYTTYATVDDGNCTDAPPCPDSNGDGAIGALEITDLLVYYNTDGGGCGVLNSLSPVELGVAPCDLPGVDCGDEGCTYPNALNFDPGATTDDGSCFWTGCTDPTMQNYQHCRRWEQASRRL